MKLRLKNLHKNQHGVSYSLTMTMILPFYIFGLACMIELILMMNVKLTTQQASESSARAASIWIPRNTIPMENRQAMIDIAAVKRIWPMASGSSRHDILNESKSSLVVDNVVKEFGDQMIATYSQNTNLNSWDKTYLAKKFQYAAFATSVVVEGETGKPKSLVVATTFERPFFIGAVGLAFGSKSELGDFYSYKITTEQYIDQEAPKSKLGDMGVDYWETPRIRSRVR